MDEEAVAESVQVSCVVSVVSPVVGFVCSLCSGLCFLFRLCGLGIHVCVQVVGSRCTESQQAELNKDSTVGPVRFFAYVLN